jgi:hypothetical protein
MANLEANVVHPVVFYETTTPLGISGEYKTPEELSAGQTPAADDWIDTRGFARVSIEVAADQASASLGFTVVESPDSSDSAFTVGRIATEIVANTPLQTSFVPKYRFMRAKYVNGATGQGSFSLFIQGHRI